jgi:hypothetical protein
MSYKETYEYKLTRIYDDGSSEVIHAVIPKGKDFITHDYLANKFNEWLDSCSYIGHDYVNHRDRK